MLLTYCNFKFSVSSNFLVFQLVPVYLVVFENLCRVLEMMMDVMLSFFAILRSCGVIVMNTISVNFQFLLSCVL